MYSLKKNIQRGKGALRGHYIKPPLQAFIMSKKYLPLVQLGIVCRCLSTSLFTVIY